MQGSRGELPYFQQIKEEGKLLTKKERQEQEKREAFLAAVGKGGAGAEGGRGLGAAPCAATA